MAIDDYIAYYKLEGDYVDETGIYTLDTIVNGGFGEDRLGNADSSYESLTKLTENDRAEYSGTFANIALEGSVGLWFKSTDTQDVNSVLFTYGEASIGKMRSLRVTSANTLGFDSYNIQPIFTNSGIIQDIWYHLVVTWDSFIDAARLYLNGKYISTVSVSMSEGGSSFAIGNLFGGISNDNHFKGNLKNIRVYDRIITNTDIQNIITEEREITPNLIDYYKMDGTSPTGNEVGADVLSVTGASANSTGYIGEANFIADTAGYNLYSPLYPKLNPTTQDYSITGWVYIDPTYTYSTAAWLLAVTDGTLTDSSSDISISVVNNTDGEKEVGVYLHGAYISNKIFMRDGWNFIGISKATLPSLGKTIIMVNDITYIINSYVKSTYNRDYVVYGNPFSTSALKTGFDEFKVWNRGLHEVDLKAEFTRSYVSDDNKFWWKLDNNYLDSSGNDNTMLDSSGSFINDVGANPLSAWDGEGSGYLYSTDALGIQGRGSTSISCWVKSNEIGKQCIFSRGGHLSPDTAIGLAIASGTKELVIDINSVETPTGYYLDDDLWHFLLLRINHTKTSSVYIDVMVDDNVVYGYEDINLSILDEPLYVSRFMWTTTYNRSGGVDDLRVYDYSISDSQASELYTSIRVINLEDVPPDIEAITDLTAVIDTNKNVLLNWGAAEGSGAYDIYRYTTLSSVYDVADETDFLTLSVKIATVEGVTTYIDVTELNKGVGYYYAVKARRI